MEVDSNENTIKKIPLNIAIVGGGRTCKSFLELLHNRSVPYFEVNLVGVCDIKPMAEGFLMAKKMGIYTTDNFQNLFDIENLDGIIELTGRRKVLLELIKRRPQKIAIVEHNLGRVLRSLFMFDQKLKSAEQQVIREKMIIDFLIQQANERIVVLDPDFSIVEASEPYLKAVTKSKDEVIGSHCYEITHGLNAPCSSSKPELGCPLTETLRTGKTAQVIHEHPSIGELPTYCDMVTYPIKDQNGDIVRVIEVWRDILPFQSRANPGVQKSDMYHIILF